MTDETLSIMTEEPSTNGAAPAKRKPGRPKGTSKPKPEPSEKPSKSPNPVPPAPKESPPKGKRHDGNAPTGKPANPPPKADGPLAGKDAPTTPKRTRTVKGVRSSGTTELKPVGARDRRGGAPSKPRPESPEREIPWALLGGAILGLAIILYLKSQRPGGKVPDETNEGSEIVDTIALGWESIKDQIRGLNERGQVLLGVR